MEFLQPFESSTKKVLFKQSVFVLSLGSGTRQAETNRPSIMNWHDGRDSCTCRCTPTGLPAQIPTELRRGSANKTQTVILEVLAMPRSTHSFLRLFQCNLHHPTSLPDYISIRHPFDTTPYPHPPLSNILYTVIIILIY